MRIRNGVLGMASLLLVAIPAFGKDHVVMVGPNGTLTFSPATLPLPGDKVQPGDTITFKNAGGTHNAHSSDANFAFSCGVANNTGTCTNGGVSSTAWQATVTVPDGAVGHTISYQCDFHGVQMSGSISVSAIAAPVELQSFDVD